MAQPLQHQDSNVVYAKSGASCNWPWSQYFGFHQRGHSRKLIADRRRCSHEDGKVKKVSTSYVPSKSTEHEPLEKEARPAKSLIINSGVKKEKSGKSLIKALFSKTLFRKYYQKKKMPPVTSQTARAHSIHRRDEISSGRETSQADSTEEGAYLLERNGKFSFLSSETDSVNHEGNHSTEKQQAQIRGLHQSVANDFVRMMDKQPVERERLAKNIEDPKFISENDSISKRTPRAVTVLNRSGSFPVTDKSERRNANPLKSKQKVFPSNHFVDQGCTSTVDNNVLNPINLSNDTQTLSSEDGLKLHNRKSETPYASGGSLIKGRKQRLKDLNTESRKEYQRISKDAFMHKIPYGKNVAQDLATPKLFRSSSARSHSESGKENIVVTSRPNSYQGLQRSLSVTESMGRYFSLSKSISTKDSKLLQEKLIIVPDDQNETTHAAPLLGEKFNPLDDSEGHGTRHAVEDGSTVSLVEKLRSDVGDQETLDADRQPTLSSTLEQNTLVKVADSAQDHSTDTYMPPEMSEVDDEQLLHNDEMKKALKLDQLTNVQAAASEQELEHAADQSDEPAEITSTSFIDIWPEGNLSGPEYLYNVADSKIDSEGFDGPNFNFSFGLEAAVLNPAPQQKSENLHNQVDQKNEAEFKYVKNLLLKSGVNGLELFSAINGELSDHLYELDVASSDYDDTPLELQLVLDLMNEELLELYEKSSAHGWLPRFASQVRPIPAGETLLEEVWAKISLQIGGQVQTPSTLEDIFARDFAKDDRWLTLLTDAESMGMRMGRLLLNQILDDLVRELVGS